MWLALPLPASAAPKHYAAADHASFVIGTFEYMRVVGDRTRATLKVIEGAKIPPGQTFEIEGSGFDKGTTFFVPLLVKQGRWQLVGRLSADHHIHRRQGKSALAEIEVWQRKSQLPISDRLDHWLNLVSHPVPFLRAASAQALRHHRLEIAPLFTPSRLAVLTTAIQEIEVSDTQRRVIFGLIAALGGDAGADWVAEGLSTRISGDLRTRAIQFLGRQRSAKALKALSVCANSTVTASAGLCRRLLGASVPTK